MEDFTRFKEYCYCVATARRGVRERTLDMISSHPGDR
jgi:hypothetical protein